MVSGSSICICIYLWLVESFYITGQSHMLVNVHQTINYSQKLWMFITTGITVGFRKFCFHLDLCLTDGTFLHHRTKSHVTKRTPDYKLFSWVVNVYNYSYHSGFQEVFIWMYLWAVESFDITWQSHKKVNIQQTNQDIQKSCQAAKHYLLFYSSSCATLLLRGWKPMSNIWHMDG